MRGVTCSAPNCTVSPMAASKAMMRPVILSRPENMADLLAIFCDGGSAMTSSPGCGDEAGDAKQSGHQTVLEHGRAGLPVNTENTAGKGPFRSGNPAYRPGVQ